jgi:hypothetical protein
LQLSESDPLTDDFIEIILLESLVDKLHERKILDMVYSIPANLQVVDFEKPDFIIRGIEQKTIGVEVTELYQHEVDAKLSKLMDYTLGLLDKSHDIHKKDREYIKVDHIEIIDKDNSSKGKATAIIRDMPTFEDKIEKLMSSIKDKEKKIETYKENTGIVDLVIFDASSIFMHEKFEDFFRPFSVFCDKEIIMNSNFREIFLVTCEYNNKSVYIPLRANIFSADYFAFASFISESMQDKESGCKVLDILLSSLFLSGHKNIKVSGDDEHFSLHYGAWELKYSDTGIAIRDRLLVVDDFDFMYVSDLFEGYKEEVISAAKMLLDKRKNVYASMNISLPVKAE